MPLLHWYYYYRHRSHSYGVVQKYLLNYIKYIMKTGGYLLEGDLVINIASIPLEDLGGSNMLKLSHVD